MAIKTWDYNLSSQTNSYQYPIKQHLFSIPIEIPAKISVSKILFYEVLSSSCLIPALLQKNIPNIGWEDFLVLRYTDQKYHLILHIWLQVWFISEVDKIWIILPEDEMLKIYC